MHYLALFRSFVISVILVLGICGASTGQTEQVLLKKSGAFYPYELTQKAKDNAEKYSWAAEIQKQNIRAVEPWMKLSDDDLWGLMFGNTISRSWMVWSDGYCPSCRNSVPMYSWRTDPFGQPWKMICPHCKEAFPKNDFRKYYQSGLNKHGIFDPKLADRGLLFNVEHPSPTDPLHKFGVDDGNGFVQDGKRWRFIGTYLVYGQWKRTIVEGAKRLAAAYVVTGDKKYARKAAILLDRIADLYPTFDYSKQGYTYETGQPRGYVSVYHDACEETRELALAYDQIFDSIKHDEALVTFLSAKAAQFGLDNPKTSFTQIQRNIESRIFRDALNNKSKIESNYPRSDIAIITMLTVLGWPENRKELQSEIGPMIRKATAVDGSTGTKGLADYTTYPGQQMALLLAQFARIDADFLGDLLRDYPSLYKMFRFHIDTWCLQKYYPLTGDTRWFAAAVERYAGFPLEKNPGMAPSMFAFLWQLYQLTGDSAFVQVMYHDNGSSVNGLPYDIFADNPVDIQRKVLEIIDEKGAVLQVGSVNMEQWHLAILRAGHGQYERAMWLDYDAGGAHGHLDALNLGLFAFGLDLLPDFGYPPVQYGGWDSPRANWYKMTAAHNTVTVDGRNQKPGAGKTTLWADGDQFHAIRASAPEPAECRQYERTAAMIDISSDDFYIIDVFRVVGGSEHVKFMQSHFGEITAQGLKLKPGKDYGRGTIMRNFQTDANPQPGWGVDWQIEDRYKYLPPGSDVHLRYTDLTPGADVSLAEGWIVPGFYNSKEEAWIPRIMIRRTGKESLASTFVGVIEPYEQHPKVASIKRLPLSLENGAVCSDANAAIQVDLMDGRSDLFISIDSDDPLTRLPAEKEHRVFIQSGWKVQFDGDLCVVRRGKDGELRRVILCGATYAKIGESEVRLKERVDFIEVSFVGGSPYVVSGSSDDLFR